MMLAETTNEPSFLPWVAFESLHNELLFLKINLQNVVLNNNNRYHKNKIDKIKGINEDLMEKLYLAERKNQSC